MRNPSYTGVRNPSNNRFYLGIFAFLSVLILFFGIVKIAINYSESKNYSQYEIVGYWINDLYPDTYYCIRRNPSSDYALEIVSKKKLSDRSVVSEHLVEKVISGYRVFFSSDHKLFDYEAKIPGSELGQKGYYDGEYYIIDTKGNLACYDWDGFICIYEKTSVK